MKKIDAIQIVALGANVSSTSGGTAQTLHDAVGALAKDEIAIRRVSRFFRTPCFPAGAGPDYVNAAVQVCWEGDARSLLAKLHKIEAAFGRVRAQRWGARSLDLDLVCFGHDVVPTRAEFSRWQQLSPDLQARAAPDRLILPHPRLQDRAFVLVPMADIAPRWRHPVLGRSVEDMLGQLPASEIDQVTAI